MVFQNYALFPHMKLRNLAFPLERCKIESNVKRNKNRADRVQMGDLGAAVGTAFGGRATCRLARAFWYP